MSVKRKLATGVVAATSVIALSGAAVPATAASSADVAAANSCTSWKNAVGVPGKWLTAKSGCGTFGNPKYKAAYRWAAERGRPCIKVLGFKKGKKTWFDAGCGKSGYIKNVPWGNVLGEKQIKIKGYAMLKWK